MADFSNYNLKNAGFVDFSAVREDFVVWLKIRGLSKYYRSQLVSYLDRFGTPIGGPMDVLRMFDGLTVGQRHQMIRAVRNLLNFYEAQGLADTRWLDLLRKNVPKDEVGIDFKVPSEAEIVESLRLLGRARGYESYFAVYSFVLDSGLRLTEAMRFLKTLTGDEAEKFGGFYVAPLGYLRKSKLAYFAFFTEYTMGLLRATEKIMYESAKGNVRKRLGKQIVSYKYLRKFAFDTMTNEELNVPESVADFIQGRTPKSIGARHYMKLRRKAIQFYPRYAEYITRLRQKALN